MVKLRFVEALIPFVAAPRTEHGNRFPLVAPLSSEIVLLNGGNGMPWINLAHLDQTSSRSNLIPIKQRSARSGLTVPVAFGELRQLSQVAMAIECDPQQFVLQP
jgi:hypothetical protein